MGFMVGPMLVYVMFFLGVLIGVMARSLRDVFMWLLWPELPGQRRGTNSVATQENTTVTGDESDGNR